VYNDQGQGIGSVIGGGLKLIAVPLSHVNLDGARPIIAGATRQMLAGMSVYARSLRA
jgi:hypothetical protein